MPQRVKCPSSGCGQNDCNLPLKFTVNFINFLMKPNLETWFYLAKILKVQQDDMDNLNRALLHTMRRQLMVGQWHSDRRQSSGTAELVMFFAIAHLLKNVYLTQSSFQWYDRVISRVNRVKMVSVKWDSNSRNYLSIIHDACGEVC